MNNNFAFGFEKTLKYFLHIIQYPFNCFKLPATFSELDSAIFFNLRLEQWAENNFEEFYNLSLKICELEALTFLSEDNKIHLQTLNSEFHILIDKLNSSLQLNIVLKDWRLIAGLYCCFMEWCHDIQFFSLTKAEQDFIWFENPLNSFPIL